MAGLKSGPNHQSSLEDDQEDQYTASEDLEQPFLREKPYPISVIAPARLPWWLIHTVLILMYTGLGVVVFHRSTNPVVLRKHELGITSTAVSYTEKLFEASDVHGDSIQITPFEGPRTPEMDMAWDNLTMVGVIYLNPEQNDQLVQPSIESPAYPGHYPVSLSVFHQLHCLNYLRILLFPQEGDGKGETEDLRFWHKNHCIGYLRQAIQCSGDLTPDTLSYDSEARKYGINHSVVHECRNFDMIYSWAAEHASDVHLEG